MKPDGGPAFPQPHVQAQGMSLRDYFAAAALSDIGLGVSGMDPQNIAALCYDLADAMLAERAK